MSSVIESQRVGVNFKTLQAGEMNGTSLLFSQWTLTFDEKNKKKCEKAESYKH